MQQRYAGELGGKELSIWEWGVNAEHCSLLYMYMYIRTNHSLDSHAPPPRSSGLSADPPVEAALLPDQLQHTKYGIAELHTSRVRTYMFSTTHIQALHHHTKYGIVESLLTHRPNITTSHAVLAGCAHPPRS